MSASLLYHTHQIENIQVKSTEYFPEEVIFNVLYQPKNYQCPCCASSKASHKGCKVRKLRIAPIGNKKSWLAVEIHRLCCCICKHVWWPSMPFATSKKRVTTSLEKYVIELMRFAAIEHTANFLGVS